MGADRLRDLGLVHKFILGLLLDEGAEPVPDSLHLQKAMFLLALARPRLGEECEFVPHYMGPYSENVENAFKDLATSGLVQAEKYGKHLRIDPKALPEVRVLEKHMPPDAKEHIHDVKALLNDLSENEVLVFTYFTYPDMTSRSEVLEKALAHRVPAALSMYRKGKVSLERAAKLAGMTLGQMRNRAGGSAA
jgi:uncharacterized protein YwgA